MSSEKNNKETNCFSSNTGDMSLRPNPDTYIDRDKESNRLMVRIEKNSASVVGIAGVRGAGKSSLALKILKICDEKGFFTLLIHSPTGYEPREFLLSIFQRVCEKVISRLNTFFGKETNLLEIGLSESRKLQRQNLILVVGVIIIFLVTILSTLYQYNSYSLQRQKPVIEKYLSSISKQEEAITAWFDQLSRGLKSTSKEYKKLQSELDSRLENLADERVRLMERVNRSLEDIFFKSIITLFPMLIILYIGLILLCRVFRKIRKQKRLIKTYPKEAGLRRLAIDTLEHLKYQTKLTSSKGTVFTLLKFTYEIGGYKTLEKRPISLPGLTVDFCSFLGLIGDVFNGKVVICLDELDKINDTQQLNNLLKGIKGIFGQQNTHFILTVSEDALTRFSTRQRKEREIVESAFEKILYLDRITPSITSELINLMLKNEKDISTQAAINRQTNIFLYWLFGTGIPREIKRNAAVCEEFEQNPVSCDPWKIWLLLYNRLLVSLNFWAYHISKDDIESYHFLCCIEKTKQTLPVTRFSFEEAAGWLRNLISLWTEFYELPFLLPNDEHLPKGFTADASSKEQPFKRAIFEIVIGAVGILFACDNKEKLIHQEPFVQLINIFDFLSTNLAFAGKSLNRYLLQLGIFND